MNMALNELKDHLEDIFAACIKRGEKIDLIIEEFQRKSRVENYIVLQKIKKAKLYHHDSPFSKNRRLLGEEHTNQENCRKNKNFNKNEKLVNEGNKEAKKLKFDQMYNPTPVSTKMHIKNILKDPPNSQTKVPAKNFKRKLIDVNEDESTNSFAKLPALIPMVTTRKPITFDDLDTDDEKAKGKYPKWSFTRYYNRRMKEQIYVDWNLVETMFSFPSLESTDVKSIFPLSRSSDLMRNESSIWET